VTGGEPLVRKNCMQFLKDLKELPATEQVTLTTNGTLLSEYLPELKRIGLDGVNISLDTLNEHIFEQITGRSEFHKVMDAVIACQASGIRTKVNSVLLQDINKDDFFQLVGLAETYQVDVRFIEIMPIGFGQQFKGCNRQELLDMLSKRYPNHVQVHEHRGNGPATYIYLPGFKGCIGFIDAIHGKFCGTCNRVRLTSDGILKLCLYYQNGIDLKSMLHAGYPDSLIRTAMEQAIFRKPTEHQFHLAALEGRRMSQIGG
jgi:cyclic pyranopterin phosphate synthase